MGVESGYAIEKPLLLARLRRVEGQIRGLQRLVDEERSCVDILTQVSASTSALEGVALLILESHLRHCVSQAANPADAQRSLTEACDAIRRLVCS